MTENKKHKWFRLKKTDAKNILIYFFVVSLLSFCGLLMILIEEINPFKGLSIFSFSLIAAIITSLLGASIFYSRKLYKACIGLDMIEPVDPSDNIRQLGIIFYYVLRPFYSACLSIITCLVLRSGTEFISQNGGINNNFPFLIMIISFFVGYSSGDLIDYLEIKGKKVVEGIFSKDNTSQNS